MNLSEIRAAHKAALDAIDGIQAYDHVPEQLVAPCAVLEPGEPYLTDNEQPHGRMLAALTVTLVVDVGTNAKAIDDLDGLIEKVLPQLPIASVGKPQQFMYGGTTYLAAVCELASDYTIPIPE